MTGIACKQCRHAFCCQTSCKAKRWQRHWTSRGVRKCPATAIVSDRNGAAGDQQFPVGGDAYARSPKVVLLKPAISLLKRMAVAKSTEVASSQEINDQVAQLEKLKQCHPLDMELSSVLGCLMCAGGLRWQQSGRIDRASSAFANALPHLKACVQSPTIVAFDWLARRFCISALLMTGATREARDLSEESAKLYSSAVSLLLCGEANCRLAERLREDIPGQSEERIRAFRRSCDVLEIAERLQPGHKRVYQIWVFCLTMLGDIEGCCRVGERAVENCKDFWLDKLQRPRQMVPRLLSKPWHDPNNFAWVQKLEENWKLIRAELDAVQQEYDIDAKWHDVYGHEKSLVQTGGTWREFPLLGYGTEVDADSSIKCPATCKLLSEIDAVKSHADLYPDEKTAMFSRLTPGTHIKPHCGPTNTHLTCHLGLKIPENCKIRVGSRIRTWEEGHCIIFDDSYEHEVWHHGDAVRTVLLFRFWHPDIPPSQRAMMLQHINHNRMDKSWLLM